MKNKKLFLIQTGKRTGKTVESAKVMFDTIITENPTLLTPDFTSVFELLKNNGATTGSAICQIIDFYPEFDWSKLWQQFEDTGNILYFSFQLYKYEFVISEGQDGVVMTPELNEIFVWSESDVFDKFSEKKIRVRLKKWVADNQYQIESKFVTK